MEKLIEQLINSNKFGNGKTSPNCYTTGWVARIHNTEGNGPEFPESVEYIRSNQLSDGSWGSKKPFSIFERITSTLIAVICLTQWKQKDDQAKIEKGADFIKNNLIHISNYEDKKSRLGTGFELLLPALIDEAKQLGLEFGQDAVVNEYRIEKEQKVNKIKYCEQYKRDIPGFGTWYFSLEGLGSLYTNEQIERMIASTGLICGCYSATAFALYRGIKSKQSLDQIREVVDDNQGAISNICSMEVFDLAWSINFLYFSGYPMANPNLVTHIRRLATIWVNNKGLVGGTASATDLPPDADDIACTLLALKLTDSLKDKDSTLSLMRFFRDKYFITFEAEMQPSITTNINCLIALSHLKQDYQVESTLTTVCKWTKDYIIENKYSFDDKWNLSKFYGMSRALIAFMYNDLKFSEIILKKILSSQNSDGGWGFQGSTALESAHVIIAVSHWHRYSNGSTCDEVRHSLERAADYMCKETDQEIPRFWLDKALYSLINTDKLAILCARYALEFLDLDTKV